jgi:hypothetical protein
MKVSLKIGVVSVLLMGLISCQENEARHPVSRKSGTFLKESLERNKKITAI